MTPDITKMFLFNSMIRNGLVCFVCAVKKKTNKMVLAFDLIMSNTQKRTPYYLFTIVIYLYTSARHEFIRHHIVTITCLQLVLSVGTLLIAEEKDRQFQLHLRCSQLSPINTADNISGVLSQFLTLNRY